jgi:hypothetical protein
MNREAAFLGTPVWSMFEGKLGAIDETLAAQGKLNLLSEPEDVVLEKKSAPVPDELPGRDPGELLALALPWLRSPAIARRP